VAKKAKPIRERILSGEALPEEQDDETYIARLRPATLAEFIDQDSVKDNLAIAIEAAKARGEPLDHVLFYGPPGLGKTTLAQIIASEMGVPIVGTSGPALERPGDLIGILTNLEQRGVLFIDEIHRLPRVVEEYLYGAMEDFVVDFVQDKGPYARSIKIPIHPCCIIGATTRTGLISAPLRERFGIFHHLDFYPEDALVSIVRRSAKILGIHIEEDGAHEIARRARGTPRIANRLLRRVRDYAQVRRDGIIDKEVADEALRKLGVDGRGLDELDRKFLRTIIKQYGGGPVGMEAIAATLNEQTDTLEEMIEPFLLKIGFVNRTPRGRTATPDAYQHLGEGEAAGATGQGRLF
jgi:Holliday junction DNA helicase RuvB